MRVGVVTDFFYPWIGGPSAAIRSLTQGLADRGHEVAILAPSPDGPARQDHDGIVEVTRAPTVPVPFGYRLRAAVPPRGVVSWLERTRPDVVNIHHPFPLSVTALLAAHRRDIPVVATNHTIPSCSLWGMRGLGPGYALAHAALAAWIVRVLRSADSVVTPTETAARLIQDVGYKGDIEVVSNGIDVDRFVPGLPDAGFRAALGVDERPIVLYTGRLDAEKDMDVWLEAAAHVLRSMPVQFLVGGEGTDRSRLERRTAQLGISDSVRFIGYVTSDRLPDLYRLATVYFITSPVELQSITTLEATASGCPVVAVRAGALPELVRDGKNGYLVMQGDAASAAAALSRLLSEPQSLREAGRESRAIALSHAVHRSVERYERILERAVSATRGHERLESASVRGR